MKQWHETREVLDRLAELAREGKRAALATVVRVRGSAYRHEGAKLLVGEDGSTTGNVSGGCLEQDVREVALQVIRSGKAELRNYCSSADEIEAWDLGVGCEGEVEVFVEPVSEPRPRERELLDRREPFVVATIVGMRDAGCGMRLIMTADDSAGDLESTELNGAVTTQARALLGTEQSGLHEIGGRTVFFDVFLPPPQLVLFGAGEDARPLARLAADVGFRVVVVDRRPGYLTNERCRRDDAQLHRRSGVSPGPAPHARSLHRHAGSAAAHRAHRPQPERRGRSRRRSAVRSRRPRHRH